MLRVYYNYSLLVLSSILVIFFLAISLIFFLYKKKKNNHLRHKYKLLESDDILDSIMKQRQIEKRSRSKILNLKIIPFIFLFGTVFLILLFYVVSPKDAWIAYSGKSDELYLEKPEGELLAKIKGIRLDSGFFTNDNRLIVNLDGKEFIVEPGQMEIDANYTYYEFDQEVYLEGIGGREYSGFIIKRLKDTLRGNTERTSVRIYHWDYDMSHHLQLKIFNGTNITIKKSNYMQRHKIESALRINDQPINFNDSLTFKISQIDGEGESSNNLYFNFSEYADIRLSINNELGESFYFKGSLESFNNYGGDSAKLNIFQDGHTEGLDVFNTSIHGSIKKRTYIHRKLEVKTEIDVKKDIEFVFSGLVNDLTIGGKTFFPNLVQWFAKNSATIITAILTAFITGLFTILSVESKREE